MKTFAILLMLSPLALPATAAIVWDENVDGELSEDPAAPTPLVLSPGSNVIVGWITGSPFDRDYITFTIPDGQMLAHLFYSLSPTDAAFTAFNAGSTSFIPSLATSGDFLAGIHILPADTGHDLMPVFVTRSVTTHSLPAPSLGPGTYCWMIQQTSPIEQLYAMDFVIESLVPAEPSTWGKVKALYRQE